MEKEIEESFVKRYIVRNRQERLLYELGNKKKRIDGIARFCHGTPELIKESTIVYSGNDISFGELKELIDNSNEMSFYVISYYESLDAKFISSDSVLSEIIGRGMASIAIFNHFVIIETEQVQGPAMKYVLRSN